MASALHCKQFSAIGQPAGEKVAIPGAVGGVTHLAVDGGGTMAVVDWRSGYTQDSVQHYTIEGRRISVTQPPDPGPDPYPDPIPIPGPPGNTAPTTSGIAEVVVDQDAPNTAVPLFDSFADAQDGDGALYYGLIGNTNVGLFSAVMIDNVTGLLTLDYAPGASGAATLTVRATDTGGASVQAAFNVTVRPVAPTPGPGPTPDPTPASTPTPNPNPVGSPPVALGNGALAGRLLTKARRRKPAGLPGVVVFIDTNLNGGWDADELSATTDAAGSYAFTGLAPGRYRVRAATPAGYELLGARRDGGLRNAVVKVKQRKPAKVKPLVLKAPPA
jgi:hypothetical protein